MSADFFRSLGSAVERRWRAQDYEAQCFPDVAVQVLSKLDPASRISLGDVIALLATDGDVGTRADEAGQIRIPVYATRSLSIEVVLAHRGSGSLDEPGWAGALHVLDGKALHTAWSFEAQQPIGPDVLVGRATFSHAEVLLRGDHRATPARSQFCSRHFFEGPVALVVIRAFVHASESRSYRLYPPSIAIASRALDGVTHLTAVAEILRHAGRTRELQHLARHVCADDDPRRVTHFMLAALGDFAHGDDQEALLAVAGIKHPALVEPLRQALLWQSAGERLSRMQQQCDDDDLRVFLTLLRHVPEQSALHKLLSEICPRRDPRATIVACIRKLSELQLLGIAFQESWLLMLECLLRRHSAAQIARQFEERYGHGENVDPEELSRLARSLRGYWLLQPLFSYEGQCA